MGGGLMQLVAYGAQDVYLTGNPQITFFKVVYRRHTNFSIESIEQTFNGQANFGKKVTCTIARNGDLMHKLILEVTLPALSQSQNSATWQGWVNSVGNAIVKSVSVLIGGQVVDKQYGEWMEIWGELNYTSNQMAGYKQVIGKYDSSVSLETNATSEKTYSIPLQFWFCRNPGLALPLIALQYHEVVISIEFRDLNELTKSDVAITSPLDTTGDNASITSASLWVDYIYLDTDERRRFAQVSHEYLIEQLQYTSDDSITSGSSIYNSNINFNHPCKELIWVIAQNTKQTSGTVSGNDWFNFASSTDSDTFSTAKFQLNGHDRLSPRKASYFRLIQPLNHHTRTPTKHIYSYSFGLSPEEHQPTGTCNFSRIDHAAIHLNFTGVTVVASKFKIYAVNYNVLRIMSGMGGLAYSN